MQRRPPQNTRNPYVRSGVAGHKTPGGKKKSPLPQLIRRFGRIALLLAVFVLAVYFIGRGLSTGNKPVYLNALPSYGVQAMGENIVYYDGITLTCVTPKGVTRWTYSLGTGGSFHCTDTTVTAWRDNQLHVLNKDGRLLLSDQLDAAIRFARTGEMYIAASVGDDMNSSVRVLDRTGALLETRSFEDLYVLDMGFLHASGQYMWVLSLDAGGNAPISNITTIEPGKMVTGTVELQDELVYGIYAQGNYMMVVDTSKIRTFSYKCVEQTDLGSTLVYGWQLKQTRTVGRSTHVLLEQIPSAGDNNDFTELRLVTNNAMQSLRLLSPCFAGGLGDKGVYAFGDKVIYYAPYGSKTFSAQYVTYPISDLLCMLSGNRAVLASGDSVMVVDLPT